MDPRAFKANVPGSLVPTIDGASAFVPAPAPPVVQLTPATWTKLANAENALGRLDGTVGRLVDPYLVANPLLRQEAILSSRIEGTYTTPEELAVLEVVGAPVIAPTSNPEDTREVLNYIKAMQAGLELLKTLPVSLRLIREIHRVMLAGVRGDQDRPGEFRSTQNWIGRRGSTIHEARFVPPPVEEMNRALDQFEKFLHLDPSEEQSPLLVRLACAHYQFEAIHPFRDGNGRIGRLLIPLILCSERRMGEPVLYLSAFLERARDEYADRLLRVSQTGDWDQWVRFFLTAVEESAHEALSQAEGLLELRRAYLERVSAARSSALLPKLIDHLFKAPGMTISMAAGITGTTPAAAAANLRKLEAAGIIQEVTGRAKGMIFLAPEIVTLYRRPEERVSEPVQLELPTAKE